MEHLQDHPHAFLDANNKVTSIYVFDGHNHDLLEQVKESISAAKVVCCCNYGMATVGGELYNDKLYPPKPYPEWIRDEENGKWVAPEGWEYPDTLLV